MENIVNPVHGVFHRLDVPDVTDEKLDLVGDFRHPRLKLVTHIVLLLLIPGKNADFTDIRVQKPIQHRIAEGAGTAGDHQGLVCKNTHILLSYFCSRSSRNRETYCCVQISSVYFVS